MTKFELDLLKEFSDDGCGGDDFDEISTLVGMRMRGYFKMPKMMKPLMN